MILVGVCQGVGDIWAIIGRSLGDQVGKMKEDWTENRRKQTSFVLTCQQAETVDDLIHVLLNLTIIAAQTRRQAQLQAQF